MNLYEFFLQEVRQNKTLEGELYLLSSSWAANDAQTQVTFCKKSKPENSI